MNPSYPLTLPGVPPNDVRNVIFAALNGATPSNTIGSNGEYIVDTSTSMVWGPMASSAWPTPAQPLLQGKNTIFGTTNGSAPSYLIGLNGDYFIDTATTMIWGPKASGAWPSSLGTLVGPSNVVFGNSSGAAPASGIGANGDYFFDVSTSQWYGPKASGAWPSTATQVAGGVNVLFGASGGVPGSGVGIVGEYFYDLTGQLLYGPKTGSGWPGTGVPLVTALAAVNTITGTSGGVAPSNSVGANGNYFYDTASGLTFGPKTTGTWPATAAFTPNSSEDAVIPITTPTTLTTAQVGGLVEWSGGGTNGVTLPAMSSLRGGFTLYNGSSVQQNVTTGVGVFSGPYASGTTTQALPAGASCRVKWDGTNWVVTDYNAVAVIPPTPLAITGGLPSGMTGTSTTAAMTVSGFTATDTTAAVQIVSGSLSWAVSNGNAANGYAGGATLPNSSTIHMYACKGSSGVCLYASTTFGMAAASAPVGYNSYVRRLFSFNTTSAGAPVGYTAIEVEGGGYHAMLSTQVTDLATSSIPITRTFYTLTVPQGIRVTALIRFPFNNYTLIISSPDEPDVAPVSYNADGSSGYLNTQRELRTNASGQLGARSSTTALTLAIVTTGFKDPRRV